LVNHPPLQPYAQRRESGVSWLGEVPAHWEHVQLGRIGRFTKGSGGTKEDEVPDGIPCIRYGDLYSKYGSFITDARSFVAPERAADYTPVRFGDVLFAGSGETLDEIGKSAVNLIKSNVVCGGDVLVLRPNRKILPRFLGYAADCPSSIHQKACMGRGITVMHVYADELKYLHIALPPLAEQEAIVRFLDHVDRRIRRAIHAKQKLIALLNEQKQAVIHRAVNRGVDADTKVGFSGNEWFPMVPAHWQVVPMRRVIRRAVDGPHHSPEYVDDGIPFLSARNIKAEGWNLEDAKYISTDDYEEFCRRVKPEVGDVLYTKGGTTGVARAVDLRFPFQVWVHVAVLKLDRRKVVPKFLAAALNSRRCYEQAQLFTRGATNQDLGLNRMKDIVLPVPPLDEQERIVAAIGVSTEPIQKAIDNGFAEIVVLREYRTRLVADVVTGKLDVREAATLLPDEVDGREPLEEADAEEAGDTGIEGLEPIEA
jgi:type I restriction enzyme S subunit